MFTNIRRIRFLLHRAKQHRRTMIKHQILTMLNIKGQDMPSIEEEFGSGGINFSSIRQEFPHQNTLWGNVVDNQGMKIIK